MKKMQQSMKRTLCIGLMALMLSAGLLPFVPTTSAAPPLDSGAHTDYGGDWVVPDNEVYQKPGTEIHLLGGNLRIKNGGSLTLDGVGVLFSSTLNNGQYGLVVEKGGTLIVKNKGYLDYSGPGGKSWHCGFMPGSNINFPKGTMGHFGGQIPGSPFSMGCYIGTSNATFDQSFFYGNDVTFDYMFMIDAQGVLFRNSTFSVFVSGAAYINESADVTFDNCTIKLSAASPNYKEGLRLYKSSAKLINTQITGMVTAINMYESILNLDRVNFNNNTGYGLQIYGLNARATSKDGQFSDNMRGINCDSGATVELTGINKITHNSGNGIRMANSCFVDSTGTELRSNGDIAIYLTILSSLQFRKGFISGSSLPNLLFAELGSTIDVEKTVLRAAPGGISQMITIDLSSDAVLNDNTFDATGLTANMALMVGLKCTASMSRNKVIDSFYDAMVMNGGQLYSTGNTLNVGGMAFQASYNSYVYSEKDMIKTTMGMTTSIYVETESVLELHQGTFEMAGNPVALLVAQTESKVIMTDTTVKAPNLVNTGIGAANNGYVRLINVTGQFVDPMHAIADAGGKIDFGWHVDIQAQWQNGVPVPGATIESKDNATWYDDIFTADADGMVSTEIIQNTVVKGPVVRHNPYVITGTFDTMTGNKIVNVDREMTGVKRVIVQMDDTAVPELNITYPEDWWYTNSGEFTMNGTASDVGSSLESVWVNIDGALVWASANGLADWTYDLNLSEGEHNLTVEARDIAGTTTQRYVNVVVDLTAPDIIIEKPVGLYVNTHEFYLNGTTEPYVDLTVDGVLVAVNDTTGAFSTLLNLTDDDYRIDITATDGVGNTNTVIKNVIVDTVPPKVASDKATGSWLNTHNFTLTGTTDGPFVKVDGVNATVDLINGTWAIKENLADGSHEFTITAIDLAGNINKILVTVNIDTVPPVLTVTTPAGTGTYYTNNATLVVTGKIVNATALTLNGANVTIAADGNFSKTVTLTTGTNTVTLVGKDLAGNEAKWTRTVILDQTPPKVAITSPKAGLVTNVAAQTVTGTVDDTVASIKQGAVNVTNTNGTFSTSYTLVAGANTITVTATDLAGNVGTASITVTLDTTSQLTITAPTKTKVTVTKDTLTVTGTAEKGSVVTINDMAVPVDGNGGFSVKITLKEGKNTLNIKSVDLAGNPATQTYTVTYNDERQYSMMMLLGLGIILMIIGLVLGLVVGRAMAKPKAPPPVEEEEEETKPAPKEEEEPEEEPQPFSPEEEEEPEEAPAPKGSLKDKQKETEAPTETTETKPVPKATKPEPKPEPKPKEKGSDSLEDLLKDLDKKKK